LAITKLVESLLPNWLFNQLLSLNSMEVSRLELALQFSLRLAHHHPHFNLKEAGLGPFEFRR